MNKWIALILALDVLPEDVIDNTYLYDKVNESFGFTTSWEGGTR